MLLISSAAILHTELDHLLRIHTLSILRIISSILALDGVHIRTRTVRVFHGEEEAAITSSRPNKTDSNPNVQYSYNQTTINQV